MLVILGLVGCETTHSKSGYAKKTNTWDRKRGFDSDTDQPAPAWWYARREYSPDYMHWGKMRRPDASAKDEKYILLNEDQCRAPHRSQGGVSSDNHREYRFYGYFMADRGYEPASDELCPIFVLQKWEFLSTPEKTQEIVANEPPPKPEAAEQATQANQPPVAKPKPAVNSTNTVTKAKAKPVVKKKVPAPVAQ